MLYGKRINRTIARALQLEETGKGKLLPLDEAIRRYVKPGMQLHLACGLGGPGAAICEIMRQYWGKDPGFVIIQSALAGHITNLVHGKLAKKLIFAASAGSGKSRKEIQKAFAEGTIEFENWSLCSLQQRLMAGALGVSFMPTRSITGSGMAEANKTSFRALEDPFGSGESVGIVKALNPDVSIVHGCVADVHGNTITPAPYGDDIWGPLASRSVVVTVEKIVSAALIRQYASLVKIPAHAVSAVAVAPMGAHPFALHNPGVGGFDAYGSDREFMQGLQAAGEAGTLDGWIKEWVLDCAGHEDYLRKLGGARIGALRGLATSNLWDCADAYPALPPAAGADYTPDEMTAVAAAREVMRGVRRYRHRTILAGAGAGLVAAWLAYYQLRASGYEIDLIQGNGQVGYVPQPGESLLRSGGTVPAAMMMTDAITTHGVFVGGGNNKCISLLGAGEIDRYANINSTRTKEGLFLSGSGGANDAAGASEVIIVLEQAARRFVAKLPFVTCPGRNVTRVVSSMGVFEKRFGKSELKLASCYPNPSTPGIVEKMARIQAHCGWKIRWAKDVKEVPAPTQAELELLRSLQPAGLA